MSNKKKKQKLKEQRQEKREQEVERKEIARLNAKIENGEMVIADQSQQAPNNSYAPPEYYINTEFECIDCGKVEIWTAKQQKWWYEVVKGSIYSTAIRCHECRKKRRQQP